jgi:chromosome segregation ATPase
MELEQILKQIDWMDEERRKDKSLIAALQERIQAHEGGLDAINQRIQLLDDETTRLSTLIGRVSQYEEELRQQRIDNRRMVDESEKKAYKSQGEVENVFRIELQSLEKDMLQLRGQFDQLTEFRRTMETKSEEQLRLNQTVEEMRTKVTDIDRSYEEYNHSYRVMEDSRRLDAKRLTDLQSEVTALRKRSEEMRSQDEMLSANLAKSESRLNDIVATDNERREAQQSFLEQQKVIQVERDRAWKEWMVRAEAFEKQAADVETQLNDLDATHRAVKRSQEELESLTERVERRINEITEMQRLSEERFRNEWTTFKSDDQKRWANYTLSQDNVQNDVGRQTEKLMERVVKLEDHLLETRDTLYQLNELTEKGLQTALSLAHDWIAIYTRSKGLTV